MKDKITREQYEMLCMEAEQITGKDCPKNIKELHWEKLKEFPYQTVREFIIGSTKD